MSKKYNFMKKLLSDEQQKLAKVQHSYVVQANKVYNYTLDDFEIFDSQWRHKDWKTWCQGEGSYSKTKKIVERYIAECKKPYGERDLNFIHLIVD